MHKDKYVFAQLAAFLDNFKFRRIVEKYEGDKYIKSYSCWNQLLTMMFGQLANRESLRDLVVALEAHSGKLYHLGMGKSVTRSNLAKANEQRDWRIFEEYAYYMIGEARKRRKTTVSTSEVRCMLSIRLRSTSVCRSSGRRSSAGRQAELRFIRCTT